MFVELNFHWSWVVVKFHKIVVGLKFYPLNPFVGNLISLWLGLLMSTGGKNAELFVFVELLKHFLAVGFQAFFPLWLANEILHFFELCRHNRDRVI